MTKNDDLVIYLQGMKNNLIQRKSFLKISNENQA